MSTILELIGQQLGPSTLNQMSREIGAQPQAVPGTKLGHFGLGGRHRHGAGGCCHTLQYVSLWTVVSIRHRME